MPFLYGLLLFRRIRGFEERGRALEKTGRATIDRPRGKVVWIHAASVGEMLSVQPLVDRILAQNTDVHCLITTVTVTSARLVRRRNNPRILHQYMPLDNYVWVKRFLEFWKPDAVIWVESEIWPEALHQVKAAGINLVMVNGRLSANSAKRWAMAPKFIRKIMSYFEVMLAQTAQDASRLASLGGQPIEAGNMKFAVPPLGHDAQAFKALSAAIGARPVLLFASTHAGEEVIAADVYQILSQNMPDLLVMVMPRHPDRGEDIAQIFKERGINFAQRSAGHEIGRDTQIYLADTLGEAGLFYRLAEYAFVGNSLITIPGGGHNLLEPAHLDCVILHGPHMWNFPEIEAALQSCGGSVLVNDPEALAEAVLRLAGDEGARQALKAAARQYVEAQSAVLEHVCTHLRPIMAKVGVTI